MVRREDKLGVLKNTEGEVLFGEEAIEEVGTQRGEWSHADGEIERGEET